MNSVLPDIVVVRANGATNYDGIAVKLTFFMNVKNNFAYLAFLNPEGVAEIKKSEYLAEFDKDCNFFIMDYTNPRSVFSGKIEAKILTESELKSAIKTYESFCNHFPYSDGYRERLEKALAVLDTLKNDGGGKLSITVEQRELGG
jgi:hypothetical protein